MTFEQTSFGSTGFSFNREPCCPCLLLLDVSDSMRGEPITELNAGLSAFRDELAADALTEKRVEIGIVTFGPVRTALQFQGAASFYPPLLYPPILSDQGDIPMGAAIKHGLDMVLRRKDEYQAKGISCYRPWVFLITKGYSTDEWQSAADAVREGEASRSFAFFAVGVQGANMGALKQISVREPLRLDGLRFKELFSWLSNSLRLVSQSKPGTDVPLQPPQGWASVTG